MVFSATRSEDGPKHAHLKYAIDGIDPPKYKLGSLAPIFSLATALAESGPSVVADTFQLSSLLPLWLCKLTAAMRMSQGIRTAIDQVGEPILSPPASRLSSSSSSPSLSPHPSHNFTPATSTDQWHSSVGENGNLLDYATPRPAVASAQMPPNETGNMARWDTSYLFDPHDSLPCPSGVSSLPYPKEHVVSPMVRASDTQLLNLLLHQEDEVPTDALASSDSADLASSVSSTIIKSPALLDASNPFISSIVPLDNWPEMPPPALNTDLALFMSSLDDTLLVRCTSNQGEYTC